MKKLSQMGDTIVEVLIAIAVISAILGGAFAVAHNSQQGVRDSQEHAQGLKLLESQVEQLRAAASDKTSPVFTLASFCMYQGSAYSTTNGNCKQDSAGNSPPGGQLEYDLVIKCQGSCSAAGGYKFNAQVTWDEVTGNGRASENMVYRLYRPS